MSVSIQKFTEFGDIYGLADTVVWSADNVISSKVLLRDRVQTFRNYYLA